MNNVKVALLYHINFNHVSLTFEQRRSYIEEYLAEILDAIDVRANISICAEDLILLKVWNPRVYERLVTHKKIKFLFMGYSHAINNSFPESMMLNYKLGKNIIRQEIPANKLQNILYPAEVEWLGNKNMRSVMGGYKGIVLGENRIDIHDTDTQDIPPAFYIKARDKGILAILSRKNISYRHVLHSHYLDGKTEKDLLEALREDYISYSKGSVFTARIDLEVVPLNRPSRNGVFQEPPIKKMRSSLKYLESQGVDFVYLDDFLFLNKDKLDSIEMDSIFHNGEEDHQWRDKPLKKRLLKTDLKKIGIKERLIWLSLLCSDNYYSKLAHLALPNQKDPLSIVSIHKNSYYRDQESALKIRALERGGNFSDLLSGVGDKDLRLFLSKFADAVSEVQSNYGYLL